MKLIAWKALLKVLGRELTTTAFLLLGVSLVVFLILYMAPGDPFAAMLGGTSLAGAERDAALQALGIPTTWYGQYLSWVGQVLQGNLGISMRSGQPVTRELFGSGLNTLFLTVGSLLVTLAVAVPIAANAAMRPYSRLSRSSTLLVYTLSALPTFWLGYLLIYFFTRKLGLFPILSGTEKTEHGFLFMLLPVFVLGLGNGALSEIVRYMREEISRVMSEDYVRTARAKGASIWKHAYKESLLLPVSQIVAAKMPFVLGGAIIVEQVFNWPGLGRVAWQAAQDRDYPVIMAITLLAAIVVRLGSFMHRTIYVAVNPRALHH